MNKYVLVVCVFLWGCSMEVNGMVYPISDVGNVKYEMSQGQLELQYQTPLETLYYSPGINYTLSSDGQMEIEVVRCGIKEECDVAAKAQQSDVNTVVIKLSEPIDIHKVLIKDSKEKVKLSELADS